MTFDDLNIGDKFIWVYGNPDKEFVKLDKDHYSKEDTTHIRHPVISVLNKIRKVPDERLLNWLRKGET